MQILYKFLFTRGSGKQTSVGKTSHFCEKCGAAELWSCGDLNHSMLLPFLLKKS